MRLRSNLIVLAALLSVGVVPWLSSGCGGGGSTTESDASTEATTQPDASGTDGGPDGADVDAADAASSQVSFTAQPQSGYSAVPLGTFTVRVDDGMGQPVSTPTAVTLSLSNGPGTLGGTLTQMTAAGTATFSDITISKGGTYKLVASASGQTVNSADVLIDPWQPFDGNLVGGTVRHVVVDPADPKVAFLTTDASGIFRTLDGTTWKQIAFFGSGSRGLAIDPTTTTTLYAGNGQSGLYKSTDRGDTWSPANAGYTNKYVNAVAIDPTNTKNVYWASNTGLLKSTDGGATWNPANDPAFATVGLGAVAVAPSNPQRLYVQAYNQQVYTSTNGGSSWTAMSGLPANVGVKTFAVHPTNDAIVYAGLGETGGGVWESTGGGAFTQIATGTPSTASVEDLFIETSTPATLLLCAYGSNVFKSTNSGVAWTGLNDTVHGGNTTLAMGVAPSDPNTIYIGHYGISGGGLSKSTNGGTSWADDSTGFVAFDVPGVAVPSGSSSTIWVGGGYIGLNQSVDDGATYTAMTTGQGINAGGDFVVRFSPTTPTTMYAGVNGAGIFGSTNSGSSWTKNAALGNVVVDGLAPSPADGNTLYAVGYAGGVYSTSNGGTSWSKFTTGQYIYTGGVAAHPTVAATAYAGFGDGVYQTVDSGQSWTKLTTPVLYRAQTAFDSAGNVYAAGATLWSSPDGSTWTDITGGADGGTSVPLSANDPASSLAIFKVSGSDVIFVGAGSNGLWRRAGGTWTQSGPAGKKVRALAQDPNASTTLYMGVKGGGLFRSLSAGE